MLDYEHSKLEALKGACGVEQGCSYQGCGARVQAFGLGDKGIGR